MLVHRFLETSDSSFSLTTYFLVFYILLLLIDILLEFYWTSPERAMLMLYSSTLYFLHSVAMCACASISTFGRSSLLSTLYRYIGWCVYRCCVHCLFNSALYLIVINTLVLMRKFNKLYRVYTCIVYLYYILLCLSYYTHLPAQMRALRFTK